MKRRFVRAVLAASARGGRAVARRARPTPGASAHGPLKGAPAVRHLRLYREGRFELAPTVVVHAPRRVPADDPRRRAPQLQHHRLARDRRLGRVRRRQLDHRPGRRDRTSRSPRDRAHGDQRQPLRSPVGQPRRTPRRSPTRRRRSSRSSRRRSRSSPSAASSPSSTRSSSTPTSTSRRASAFVGIQERGDCGGGRASSPATQPASFALDVADEDRADVRRRPHVLPERLRVARRRVPRPALRVEPRRVRLARLGHRTGTSPTARSTRTTRRSSSTRWSPIVRRLLVPDEAPKISE